MPFLEKAVESILLQTLEDFELVVVDDGSTDGTPDFLERCKKDKRVKVFALKKNAGIVHALNFGLKHCHAPLVARQDADDVSTVTRLEIQKKFLDDRPKTILCGTGMYVVDPDGRLLFEVSHPCSYPVIREQLKTGCVFVHGSVMYRKDAILQAGGYSPELKFRHAEDYELWVRLAKDHVLENIPGKTLYYHRNHDGKIGHVHQVEQSVATKMILVIAKETL